MQEVEKDSSPSGEAIKMSLRKEKVSLKLSEAARKIVNIVKLGGIGAASCEKAGAEEEQQQMRVLKPAPTLQAKRILMS